MNSQLPERGDEVLLSAEAVLAVLAGEPNPVLSEHVRRVMDFAVTTPVFEEGPMADSDLVLTMMFDHRFTRAELLAVRHQMLTTMEGSR